MRTSQAELPFGPIAGRTVGPPLPYMAAVLLAMFYPVGARAQEAETLLIQPAVPQGFDRGRNVSVAERPRPSFDPIGIRLGSFNLQSRVEAGGGATSNVYLAQPGGEIAAPFVYVRPTIDLQSGWSRHALGLNIDGESRRFIGRSARNENSLAVTSLGRLDVSRSLSVNAELSGALGFDNPFSGEVIPTVGALSHYHRLAGSLRGQYRAGRIRAIVAADGTGLDYQPLRLTDGTFRDQRDRDRTISRLTGQLEYARTPSLALFAQLGYTSNDYRVKANSSTGYRLLGGVNFDLAGRGRGTIGAGYSTRHYATAGRNDISGISAEARVEIFPTELTTISLAARRVLSDAQFGTPTSYWDNQLTLSVDHELLRNLILNATAGRGKADYVGIDRKSDTTRLGIGARYLSSRRLELKGTLRYDRQTFDFSTIANRYKEMRAQLGVVLKL